MTYELFGPDAGFFEIDPVTHVLRFIAPADFDAFADASQDNVYELVLQVTDDQGGLALQSFEVTVTNANDAPTDVFVAVSGVPRVPVGFSIDSQTRIGRIGVLDDLAGTNNIFLSGPDADKFTLVVENGETFLEILPAATASFATANTISVDVNVDDPTLGGPIDLSTTYSITSVPFEPDDFAPLISETERESRVVTYSFEQFRFVPFLFSGASRPYTEADKQAARDALQAWDDASGLVFVEVPAGFGDLRFHIADLKPDTVSGVIDGIGGTNIAIDPVTRTEFWTLAHEIGHGIGLFHSFPEVFGNPGGVDPILDFNLFTVMSYAEGPVAPAALGPLDVDAAQFLYGQPDLGSYTFSFAVGGNSQFHYVGTGGDDEIFGNRRFINKLEGGAGDDALFAVGFKNHLTGGAGDDELHAVGSSGYTAAYSGAITDYAFEYFPGELGEQNKITVTDTQIGADGVDSVFSPDSVFGNVLFDFAGEGGSFGDLFNIVPADIEFSVNGVDVVSSFAVPEDSPPLGAFGMPLGSVIDVVMQSDLGADLPELPEPLFTLIDGGPFQMVGKDLYLFGELDFEATNAYDIVIEVNAFGSTYQETIHIDIANVSGHVVGTPFDDDGVTEPFLFGSKEEDTVLALAGDDVIFQTLGGDDVDGGEGADIFALFAPFANYSIAENPDGSFSFSYEAFNASGLIFVTDVVRNVEFVRRRRWRFEVGSGIVQRCAGRGR